MNAHDLKKLAQKIRKRATNSVLYFDKGRLKAVKVRDETDLYVIDERPQDVVGVFDQAVTVKMLREELSDFDGVLA